MALPSASSAERQRFKDEDDPALLAKARADVARLAEFDAEVAK